MTPKYEYKTFCLTLESGQVIREDQSIDALQKLGEEGWRVLDKIHSQGMSTIFILERTINNKESDIWDSACEQTLSDLRDALFFSETNLEKVAREKDNSNLTAKYAFIAIRETISNFPKPKYPCQ